MFWGQKHPVSEAQLNAYVDGRVGRAEHTRIEAHVGSCVGCRETIEELGVLRRTLRALPREAAPRSFALRQSDVAPASRGLTAAMPALTGVTMAAFLTFGVLISFDMNDSGGNSADKTANALRPASQSAEGATTERSATAYDANDGAQGLDDYSEDVAINSNTVQSALRLTATAGAIGLGTPFSTPAPATVSLSNDSGSMALRVGEIAAASVGLVAGGSLAAVWWRRKA